jgi:antitoxin component of MazEF toxin-antitoxin module
MSATVQKQSSGRGYFKYVVVIPKGTAERLKLRPGSKVTVGKKD